ncbi:MAG TPA: nicotinamide riboside transporter PnuC [Bacteroidia bacterium]|nr:nicotinamide riboside transporter PnuC [Bacteroidia bacterium]
MEAITSIEIAAVVLAILYLVLAAFQNIWCWLAAAISSILYVKICFDAQLFIETGLQVFYLIMAIVGYYNWQKNSLSTNDEKRVSNIKVKEFLIGLLCCSVISFAMAIWFQQNTNAKLPWLDAPVTIFSVWATWLVIQRVIENWLLWIVIDSIAVYIYWQRDLNITAFLYILYTFLALIGYFKWKKIQSLSIR